MIKLRTLILLPLGLAGAITAASAEDTAEVKAPQNQEQPAKVELKGQTNCPVMGGDIDKEYYSDVQGQRIYYCCPGCAEKLKADPDKYFKKAAEEGVVFENVQTACPVAGGKPNHDVSLYYEGRMVYFCCEGCIDTFKENPRKYLSALDGDTDVTKEKKEQPAEHQPAAKHGTKEDSTKMESHHLMGHH